MSRSSEEALVEAAPIKSDHAELLNRLSEMQGAAYYATARATLAEAESTIVSLEKALRAHEQAQAEPVGWVTAADDSLVCRHLGVANADDPAEVAAVDRKAGEGK